MKGATGAGFELQKVTITLESIAELPQAAKLIDQAMATYSWIYQEHPPHDVIVKLLVPARHG